MRRGAAVALAVLASAALTQTASAARPKVAFVDCTGASPAKLRPKVIILACGDGNAQLVDLAWKSWGAAAAVGVGRAVLNDCTPSCVGGKFHEYPMLVKLERIRPCPQFHQYTRLTIIYTGQPFPPGPRRIADLRGCATPGS